MANKKIHIIGGGTHYHLRPHLSLCSPAYGTVARRIAELCMAHPLGKTLDVELHLTKMANSGVGPLDTNADIEALIDRLTADPSTKIIFLTAAMCDFEGSINQIDGNKYGERLKSRLIDRLRVDLVPAQKIVGNIRAYRKDIFSVAFKTTCGDDLDTQYIAGLNLLKEAGANLVLANDVKNRRNIVITPEKAKYSVTQDRDAAIKELVDITLLRSQMTFTRSKVVDGEAVPWNSSLVPDSLRQVVNYCIKEGAYKVFRGSTVGHFAFKVNETNFVTTIRKSNFNDLDKVGMVRVVTDGPDDVMAFGFKPSVGGHSQRIIFKDHPEYDCIAHFHSPKRPGSIVPEVSQREVECGSHQCGEQTSRGLLKFGNLSAVFLKEHGPNIVFNRNIDPQEVIDFIKKNFDLSKKTGGYVSLGPILQTDLLETVSLDTQEELQLRAIG